jgi:hypothetical protein
MSTQDAPTARQHLLDLRNNATITTQWVALDVTAVTGPGSIPCKREAKAPARFSPRSTATPQNDGQDGKAMPHLIQQARRTGSRGMHGATFFLLKG